MKMSTSGKLGWGSKEEEAPGDPRYEESEMWGRWLSVNSGELDGYC